MKPSLELLAADGKSEGHRATHGQAVSSIRDAYREAIGTFFFRIEFSIKVQESFAA